jgi:hypothetical protein
MWLTSHNWQVGLKAGVNLGQTISYQIVLLLGLTPNFGVAVQHPLTVPVSFGFMVAITFNAIVSHKLFGKILG